MKHYATLLLAVLFVAFAGMFNVEHVGAATVLPAFPGAMGGGTTTPGGRGGQIIEITNLNTSGAGSYSDCVAKTFPRTCTCRVAGIIPIPKDVVTGGPNLTIDGQTCPGGGIILGDGKTTAGRALVITQPNVVVRYLTVNPNNPNTPTGPDTGTTGIEIEAPNNVVIDHISCFEAGNKCIIHYTSDGVPIQNVTEQWNLYTLPNVGHPVGPMTDTSSLAYQNINQDFHHNFFAWIGHRIALYNTTQGRWVNNLTWNWCDPTAQYGFAMEPQGPSQVDMIGNVWKKGNMNAGCSNPHPVNVNATGSSDCNTNCWNGATQPSHYMLGNACDQGTDWQCAAKISTEGGPETGAVPPAWQRAQPLPSEPNPILADPVTGLDTKILATVGNSQGLNCDGTFNNLHRNSVDAMVIAAYPNGNGFLFNQNVPNPVIPPATPCAEDSVTKVPTAYLQLRGIPAGTNPWTIWPGDTYSILETWANGSGSVPPPPQPPVVSCTPSSVPPGANSACGANQAITNWTSSAGAITPTGTLTAPMTPTTVTVSGRNANGTGNAPVVVASVGQWQGWLGFDALTGTLAVGNTVVVNSNAGQLRTAGCGSATPVSPQPSPLVGVSVKIIGGPASCNGGIQFWQIQSGAAPPVHPTVSCPPATVGVNGTLQCTADQAVTWSASAGSITAAGVFTAPAIAQTVSITGTNANGSGVTPVTVTSAPPVTTYPTVSFTIGVPGGPQTSVTCVANQTTGAYSCK